MIVSIVGSRDYPRLDRVESFVRGLAAKYPDAVICSGGARGVDSKAEETARACGLKVISYRPKRRGDKWIVLKHAPFAIPVKDAALDVIEFDSFRDAAFERNGWIVDEGEVVTAFWDEVSRGTKDSIDKSLDLRVPLGQQLYVYGRAGELVSAY